MVNYHVELPESLKGNHEQESIGILRRTHGEAIRKAWENNIEVTREQICKATSDEVRDRVLEKMIPEIAKKADIDFLLRGALGERIRYVILKILSEMLE